MSVNHSEEASLSGTAPVPSISRHAHTHTIDRHPFARRMRTYATTPTRSHACNHLPANTHMITHARVHARTHARTRSRACTRIPICTHGYATYAYTHGTHAHAYMNTNTHYARTHTCTRARTHNINARARAHARSWREGGRGASPRAPLT